MGDRRDPFEDFVRPDFIPPGLRRREFTAEELRPKWENHRGAELDGCRNSHEERPKTDGILPRSSRRIPACRWRPLTDATRRRLESKEYSERVNSYLDERERRKNPKPHFAGLILHPDDRPSSLGVKGKELVKRVGRDHVHLFLAYAKRAAQSTAQCCVERIA
jgi:hypothetical protein